MYIYTMETIPKSDCKKIGFIRKTHGIRGELVLEYDPHFENSVAETNRFFLEIDGLLVPFFLAEEGVRFKSAHSARITFDWVTTEKYANRLVNNPVYLYLHEITDKPDDSSFNRFLNFMIINEFSEEIGVIESIDDYSGNIVLTIHTKNREILVPYNNDFLMNLDEKNKIIQLRLPEGLTE